MPAVYEHYHVVSDDDVDAQDHASNVAYVAWMQAAAFAHSAAQGWPPDAYLSRGFAWLVRRHEIEYLQPARPGEEIVIRTWVATMDKVRSQRRYEICRRSDNQTLAVAVTTWVFVDTNKNIPRRIPAEVAEAFEVVAD